MVMGSLILKSNTRMTIGDKPMVLLPLDTYEKLARNSYKLSFKKLRKDIKKSERDFLIVASESSLSKDWLKPAEEKVWQNL